MASRRLIPVYTAPAWLSPDVDRRPKPLVELEVCLEMCKIAGDSGGSIMIGSIGRGTTRETTLQEAERVAAGGRPNSPDPATEKYRRMYDRFIKRVKRLADDCWEELDPDLAPDGNQRTGWKCANCKRYRPRRASFCERCGTPKPGDVT